MDRSPKWQARLCCKQSTMWAVMDRETKKIDLRIVRYHTDLKWKALFILNQLVYTAKQVVVLGKRDLLY